MGQSSAGGVRGEAKGSDAILETALAELAAEQDWRPGRGGGHIDVESDSGYTVRNSLFMPPHRELSRAVPFCPN